MIGPEIEASAGEAPRRELARVISRRVAMIADAAERRPEVTRDQLAAELRRLADGCGRIAHGLDPNPPRDTAAVDSACLVLSRVGERWREELPPDAAILHDGDPVMRDRVRLADGTELYRAPESQGPRQWWPLGWSDAGQAQARRPERDDRDGPDAFRARASDEGEPWLSGDATRGDRR